MISPCYHIAFLKLKSMICRRLLEQTRQLKRRQEVDLRLSVSATKKEAKIRK